MAPARSRGFSITELMIALLVGALIMLAVSNMFVQGTRNYRQDDAVAKMQDEARFAMSQITRDLEMAGFWTNVLDPSVTIDASLAAVTAGDCGTAGSLLLDDLRHPVEYVDNATPASANAKFPCIAVSEFPAVTSATHIGNPDVVAIKRVASEVSYFADSAVDLVLSTVDTDPATPPEVLQNYIYLQVASSQGTLFRGGAPMTTTFVGRLEYWRYAPVIYYIRNYSDQPGDGVPSLCRKILVSPAGEPTMTAPESTECLASGVEDLQVEYGVDTDEDSVPNYYVSTPNIPAVGGDSIVAARVSLLARSERPDANYDNDQTYVLNAGKTNVANDNFYRRVLSTTVLLRNPAAAVLLRR